MNRILTDAARKRTERIEELERQIEQADGKRVNELEVVAAQRANLVNERNKELAAVREELIKFAELVNEKDKQLAVLRDALTKAEEDWVAVNLLLRKAQAGRAGAEGDNDYDVIGANGMVIGRIFEATTSPGAETPWMWRLINGYDGNRTPTHGYEATRHAAMRAFARGWYRET